MWESSVQIKLKEKYDFTFQMYFFLFDVYFLVLSSLKSSKQMSNKYFSCVKFVKIEINVVKVHTTRQLERFS